MKRLSFVACRLSRLSPRTYLHEGKERMKEKEKEEEEQKAEGERQALTLERLRTHTSVAFNCGMLPAWVQSSMSVCMFGSDNEMRSSCSLSMFVS